MKSILHLLFTLLHYVASSPKGDFIKILISPPSHQSLFSQGAGVASTVYLLSFGVTRLAETTRMTTRWKRSAAWREQQMRSRAWRLKPRLLSSFSHPATFFSRFEILFISRWKLRCLPTNELAKNVTQAPDTTYDNDMTFYYYNKCDKVTFHFWSISAPRLAEWLISTLSSV